MAKFLSKRSRIEQELYDTEVSYVHYLETLIVNCIVPLRQYCNELEASPDLPAPVRVLLCQNIARSIFSVIEQIHELGQEFCRILEDSNVTVLEAFDYILPRIKICYSTYISNFSSARQMLANVQKQEYFTEFFREMLGQECWSGLELDAFLILPVQRVTRYRLLLTGIISHSEKNSSYSNALQNVYDELSNIISTVNNDLRMREQSSKEKLQFQNGFISEFLDTARVFVLEGYLNKICTDGRTKRIYAVLFSDILMYNNHRKQLASTIKRAFKANRQLDLVTTLLVTFPTDDSKFMLFNSVGKSIIFQTESLSEKVKWTSDLSSCITNLIEKNNGVNFSKFKDIHVVLPNLKNNDQQEQQQHRMPIIRQNSSAVHVYLTLPTNPVWLDGIQGTISIDNLLSSPSPGSRCASPDPENAKVHQVQEQELVAADMRPVFPRSSQAIRSLTSSSQNRSTSFCMGPSSSTSGNSSYNSSYGFSSSISSNSIITESPNSSSKNRSNAESRYSLKPATSISPFDLLSKKNSLVSVSAAASLKSTSKTIRGAMDELREKLQETDPSTEYRTAHQISRPLPPLHSVLEMQGGGRGGAGSELRKAFTRASQHYYASSTISDGTSSGLVSRSQSDADLVDALCSTNNSDEDDESSVESLEDKIHRPMPHTFLEMISAELKKKVPYE